MTQERTSSTSPPAIPAGAAPPASPLAAPDAWNLVSDGYADEAHAVVGPFSERAVAMASLSPTADVLDVACGAGATTLLLAPRVARVHALDFSAGMLARLRRSLAAQSLTNVEVREGDGQALPYGDTSFDAAFSMFGLMFFPDRAQGLAEVLRVLRPGGLFVMSSWAPFAQSTLMQALMEAVAAANPDPPPPGPPPSLPLTDADALRGELEAAGFVDVVVEPSTLELEVGDPEVFWSTMTRSNVLVAMLRRRLGEQAWEARAALGLAALHARFAAHPGPLATTALLARGKKPAGTKAG